jgi:hypothetical protein
MRPRLSGLWLVINRPPGVSESSSFCLFLLPPHQDRRQKLELSLT